MVARRASLTSSCHACLCMWGGCGMWRHLWQRTRRAARQVIRSTVSVMFVLNIDEIVYEVRASQAVPPAGGKGGSA